MMEIIFHVIDNIVEKRDDAGNQRFLLFPICFKKLSLLGLLKLGIMWIESWHIGGPA